MVEVTDRGRHEPPGHQASDTGLGPGSGFPNGQVHRLPGIESEPVR